MIINGDELPTTAELYRQEKDHGLDLVLERDPRIKYLRDFGSNVMDYSTLQRGLDYLMVDGMGYIAFRLDKERAFTIADPICHPDNYPLLIREFMTHARENSSDVIALQLSQKAARVFGKAGMTINQMGTESYIDPQTYSYEGPSKAQVRRWCRKAKKEGVIVIEAQLSEIDIDEVEAVSDTWLGEKGEQEFDLLTRPLIYQDELEVRNFYALKDGKIIGITIFDPMFHEGSVIGYYHDIIRVTPDAPIGTTDLIVQEALAKFKQEGVNTLSFGLSPFYNLKRELDGYNRALRKYLQFLFEKGEDMYPAKGIASHKSKYRPVETPSYVAMTPINLTTIRDMMDEVGKVFDVIGMDSSELEDHFFD
ncbi:MAG: DUF2156 domain-containing protein [Candidatus Woesearchaeota archaeon]